MSLSLDESKFLQQEIALRIREFVNVRSDRYAQGIVKMIDNAHNTNETSLKVNMKVEFNSTDWKKILDIYRKHKRCDPFPIPKEFVR